MKKLNDGGTDSAAGASADASKQSRQERRRLPPFVWKSRR